MTSKGKQQGVGPKSAASATALRRFVEQSQLDFEIEFFGGILQRFPEYVDVLRVMASNLTLKKRYKEGLEVDRQLMRLRPNDPMVHYNLACSYALLRRTDAAVKALRRAIDLGYHDFRYLKQDRDLDSIRDDARFRQLLREFDKKESN